MARYYVTPDDVRGDTALITGEDVRHIRNVLRAAPGDPITLCDGLGTVYDSRIERIGDTILCRIISGGPDTHEPDVRLTVVQAIPKGDKMDAVIQKCVELGASRIIPVYSEFTVVRPDPKGDANKLTRWQRIAREAAKQCCRGVIPTVDSPAHLTDAAAPEEGETGIMAWERCTGNPKGIIRSAGSRVRILIGSEGGFSAAEAAWAESVGYKLISMGPRILRSETAGPALCAAVMYESGNWNNTEER